VARVGIIGAGVMGLAAAYHCLQRGHRVTVVEADRVPGGMAAHFDFDGLSIERFYHFVCKADHPTFELMAQLGLADRMRWVPTSMGYFVGGHLHDWGNPIALLKFPGLSPLAKLRYGLMMLSATRRRDPGALEHMSARQWIEGWCGKAVYDRLWRPLFDLKFYEFADDISAAWIWARIKRVGTSRRTLMQEELGYIEGGSQTLVDGLVAAITARGGELRMSTAAKRVEIGGGCTRSIATSAGELLVDAVISTVPTPYVSRMIPDLPAELRRAYDAIANIGVVCVILRLKRSVTRHFWVNVADPRIAIPGFVEFSNLRPTGDTIVYVPYYMPATNPKFARRDAEIIAEAFGYLRLVNPALCESDLIAARAGRLAHAQPVCPPGFLSKIPPIHTPIAGLQIADTCFYYPEDRGIAESVRLGKLMAEAV
jgi:protoporphyrinogen oxidase